ncbi:MAG: hypothetical protein ACI3YH_03160 [Eubacteriales bacterium]
MNLPKMVYASGKMKTNQTAFGGMNHSESASDGEIYDMQNLSSDAYPFLAPRSSRYLVCAMEKISNLVTVGNVLYFVNGSALCRSETIEKTVNGNSIDWMAVVEDTGVNFENSGKILCVMGKRLIMRMDGEPGVYNTETGVYKSMGLSIGDTATVGDGTLYEESAAANTITMHYSNAEGMGFSKGDAVHIAIYGGQLIGETDAVIREISGTVISFDENTFDGMTGTWSVTIERKVPDFDHICVCNNRLFACKGNTVWASALGDPFNWYVYDGISTDAWSVETEDSGEFTACCEFLGYPYFFKSDAIYKLFGSYADEYRLQKTNAFGVKEGASGSTAAVGSTLFYLSPAGVCAFSGGYPSVILTAEQLGGYPNSTSRAASTGSKYYLKLWLTAEAGGDGSDDGIGLFVYDVQRGLWHKEDGTVTPCAESGWPGTRQRNLYGISQDGIWLMGTPAFTMSDSEQGAQMIGHREEIVESFAEFGYAFHDTTNTKQLYRLTVRLQAEEGARIKIRASCDDGAYKTVFETRSRSRQTLSIPIRPQRCDRYRLKIEGSGDYKIYAITKEYSVSGK